MSTWSRRAMWPWGVTRSWYHVGRPSMLEGKTFLGATGIPIWKIARVRIRFAVWLPEPLTVAAWMVRSLMIWLVTWSWAADCEFYAHVRAELGVQAADWLQSTTCEGRYPQGDRARRTPGRARPRLRDQACRSRPRGQRRVGRRIGGIHHRRGLPAGRRQDRQGRHRPDGGGGCAAQGASPFGRRGRADQERRGPGQLLAARHPGGHRARSRQAGRDRLQSGAGAAHFPSPVDGRAVLAGVGGGLQGGPDGCRAPGQIL